MTVFPDYKSFARKASGGTLVPVWSEVMGDLITPFAGYAAIAGEGPSFLLESVVGAERASRFSFVGAEPVLSFSARGPEVRIEGPDGARTWRDIPPFAALAEVLAALRQAPEPRIPRFAGGAVGYIAYDAVRSLERLGGSPEDTLGLPDILLHFYDRVAVFDRARGTVSFAALAPVGDPPAGERPGAFAARAFFRGLSARKAYDHATARALALEWPVMEGDDRRWPWAIESVEPPRVESNPRREVFEGSVARVLDYIRAGDAFQVVLSRRFHTRTDASPLEIYRALRVVNPSPYMFLVHAGSHRLVGSSPEVLIRVEGRRAIVRPIAGTRRRGPTPEDDARLEAELLADPKERAEHLMLLDLARNDLGRVCEFGSIRADEVMKVERYSHVMHMTSEVSGTLKPGVSAADAFAAAFPAGTVTGAPKVRAMQIIDELEPIRRGPYAGAVGYFDFTGNLDMAIAIRTLTVKAGWVYAQSGAGVVADSTPAREYEETAEKARVLLAAVAMAEKTARRRGPRA